MKAALYVISMDLTEPNASDQLFNQLKAKFSPVVEYA